MARRPSLVDMLDKADPAEPASPPESRTEPAPLSAVPAPTPPTDSEHAAKPKAATKKATTATPPPNDTGPRYLELTRKEARFTDLQLEDLTALARQLNKARRGSGERITENTLIRIAVDLLLKDRNQLVGTTEAELRNSVRL